MNQALLRSIRHARKVAIVGAVLLHTALLCWLLWPHAAPSEGMMQLAVMELVPYDPTGGEEGSGDGAAGITPDLAPVEPAPIREPEPETAAAEPVVEEALQVMESVSDKSEDAVPPTPEPPKEKPLPRKKIKSAAPPRMAERQPAPPSGGPGGVTRPGGTGRGGTGGGSGIGTSDAGKAYMSHILYKLNRYKKYPSAARSKRHAGVVTMYFTVNRHGEVTSSRLVKSSGSSMLDEEAQALLKRVSPFKPIPAEVEQDTLSMKVPIRFSVQ